MAEQGQRIQTGCSKSEELPGDIDIKMKKLDIVFAVIVVGSFIACFVLGMELLF